MNKEVCTPRLMVVTSWGSEGGAEWVWTRWAKRCFNTKMNESKYNRIIFTILGSSNMGVILFFVEYFLKFQKKKKKIKSALKISWTRWHQLFRREWEQYQMDETKSQATSSLFNVTECSRHGHALSSTRGCLLQAQDKGALASCTGVFEFGPAALGRTLGGEGSWASPLVTGEWSQWRRGLFRVTQEAVIKAHLHPLGSAQMLLPQSAAPTPGLGEACQLSLSALLVRCTSPA